MKLKNKTKFLLVIGIIFVSFLLFNTNMVNATTSTTEEVVKKIIDLIPNSMELDIPEIEYEKGDEIVIKKVKSILESNGYKYEEKYDEYDQLYLSLKEYSDIEVSCQVSGGIHLGKDEFYTGAVYVKNTSNSKSKKIKLQFSNSKNRNSADEQYVRNLKITSPKYYEVNLDFLKNTNDISKIYDDLATKSYEQLINDKSIQIRVAYGAAGSDEPLNFCTYESGTWIGIFRNGILYDIRKMGWECIVPVINVPSTVTDDEFNNYIIKKITEQYEEFGKGITKIEKGTKSVLKHIEYDIPNGYSIYSNNGESCIIVNREKPTQQVTLTDKTTNIKIEFKNGVLPNDTVLQVTSIKDGTTYNMVKKVLTNTNKFEIFDITLLSNNVKIQPNGKVKISIPIPSDYDKSKLVLFRVSDNGEKTEYKVTTNGEYVTFETDHFSTYVLAEKKTENTTTNKGEKDETPKTGTIDIIGYVLLVTTLAGVGIVTLKKK